MPQLLVTAKALKEQRAKLIAETRAATLEKAEADGGREMTAEEQAAFDRVYGTPTAKGEAEVIAEKIARLDRCEAADLSLSAPAGDPLAGRTPWRPRGTDGAQLAEHSALAVQAWFRANTSRRFPLSDRHREACEAVGLDPTDSELGLQLLGTDHVTALQSAFSAGPRQGGLNRARAAMNDYRAALSSQVGSTGGIIMAPETMTAAIEVNMLAYGGVLQAAEIMRTETTERIRWPTANDTSNKGRQLEESQAVTTTAQPSFGAVYWDAYKFTSDEILVPYELLQGTPFSLPTIIGNMLGERLGRIQADKYTTGGGNSTPKGIVTAATSFSAAGATAIAWDDLENLIAAVDPAYRAGASFMFHDTVRAYLKKLKDSTGRPLWQDGPNGTEPADLKGYPWFINQSMDNTIASGKYSILFGQLFKYKVRQVQQVRIYRLTERFRENDQDAFLAFVQADGNLVDAGTAPVKKLAH